MPRDKAPRDKAPRDKVSAGDDTENIRISVPLMGDSQANTALGDSEDGTVFIGHLDKYEGKWGPPPVPRVEGEPPIEAPLDAPAWGDAPEADLGFFVDASTEKPASVDIAVRYMAEWDEVRVNTYTGRVFGWFLPPPCDITRSLFHNPIHANIMFHTPPSNFPQPHTRKSNESDIRSSESRCF